MSNSKTAEFLREHPKLLGVLFGITMLMAEMGGALAGAGSTISGP